MVTHLYVVLLFVLIPTLKLAAAENDSARGPGSLEESKESRQTYLCDEVCKSEVTAAELKNEKFSPKEKECGIGGIYNRCSARKISQCGKNSTYYTEYELKNNNSSENLTNCSFVCLMNSSPCLMECDCVYDADVIKRELILKHPWYITDVDLHCQDLKLKRMEVTAYISWKIQRAIDYGDDVSLPRRSFFGKSGSESLLELNGTSLMSGEKYSPNNPFAVVSPPARFAVQLWLDNSDTWENVGETNMTIMRLDHLCPNISFQVKVQGLDVNGSVIGEEALSPWIRTTEAKVKPEMVKEIWVNKMFPGKARGRKRGENEERKLNVEIMWEPNEDMLCSYNLAWFHSGGDRVKEIRPPKANFQILLKDIEYSTDYSLKIVAVYPERDKYENLEAESDEKCLYFKSLSCEEIWNHNFTICPPPAPENYTYELIPKDDIDGSPLYDLKIIWSLPDYAMKSDGLITLTLLIPGYKASQRSAFDNSTIYHPIRNDSLMGVQKENNSEESDTLKFQVSYDRREMTIPSLVITPNLVVTILCESEGGASEGKPLHIFSPKASQSFELDTPPVDIGNGVMYWAVIFVTLLALTIFLLFMIFRRWRKQPIEKKNKYFEEMSKAKGAEDDGNEVGGMLHEQTVGGDLELVESDPEMGVDDEKEVDEFEITLSRLVIRELLGEGAFGVVYKGYYRSTDSYDIDDKRNPINRSGSISSSWEVVAVKMLREGASAEEEKQLIHEMETLKYLGKSSHPNVVSLIGCHTRKVKNKKIALGSLMASDVFGTNFSSSKPLLLLIVEHCALGDLQSYLQKVWRESGTFDSVMEQRGRNIFEGELGKVMKKSEIKYINEIPDKNLNERTLKYATLDHSSSSKEDVNVNSSSIIISNHSYGISLGLNDDKLESDEDLDTKKLSPANLLSYARQIVMGMEFLAGHKVVHRDLAARNVLICGDGCTVKISDFGMSRDVYLQNVYYKSSTQGKLPIKWMAPEALLHRIYTTHSDVWSFGILLWEIITLGGTPYPGIEMNEVFKLLQTGYRMERPSNCSYELYQLMRWCWQERPSSRPSFSQLRYQLENLLEQNSASTYLSLPNFTVGMNGSQLSCQISSISEFNDISRDCESHESGSDGDSPDMQYKSDVCSRKITCLKKSSSNPTLRNGEVESGSDPMPLQKRLSSSEDADYITPISVSTEY